MLGNFTKSGNANRGWRCTSWPRQGYDGVDFELSSIRLANKGEADCRNGSRSWQDQSFLFAGNRYPR